MMPVRNGSTELHALALRLTALGPGSPVGRVHLLRGLKAGAKPLVVAVKHAATERLPHGGGLNQQVASQKVTVSVRTGARTAGVRLVTRAPDTLQTDQGFVRHPTYGRRGKGDWKRQEIPNAAGWWSQTLAEGAPKVTPQLLMVMSDIGAQIQGLHL